MTITTRYSPMTAHRAACLGLRPSRTYGYVIRIEPAVVHESTGEDVEGVGWVPHWGGPRKRTQYLFGWYKHKADAFARANQLNRLAP